MKTLPNVTKKEGLCLVQTKNAENRIREAAKLLGDDEILAKISGIDLIAKELKFHHSCRCSNLSAATRVKKTGQQSSSQQKPDKRAMTELIEYVKTNIILGSRPEYLVSTYERYCLFCEEYEEESTISSARYLGELLKKQFPTDLTISSPVAKKSGSLVHNRRFDYRSIKEVYNFKSSPEGQLVTSALLLRKHLKGVNKNPLSDPLDVDALVRGEGKAPPLAHIFFETLFGGGNRNSETVKRRATAAIDDALFNVHNGQLMPKNIFC